MTRPLRRYHSGKDSIFLYRLFRGAHFSDCAIKEHRNFVGILNSSHPMSEDNRHFCAISREIAGCICVSFSASMRQAFFTIARTLVMLRCKAFVMAVGIIGVKNT